MSGINTRTATRCVRHQATKFNFIWPKGGIQRYLPRGPTEREWTWFDARPLPPPCVQSIIPLLPSSSHRTFLQYCTPQIFSKIFQNFFQFFSKIFPKFSNFFPNFSKFFSKFFSNFFPNFFQNFPNFTQFFSNFFQNLNSNYYTRFFGNFLPWDPIIMRLWIFTKFNVTWRIRLKRQSRRDRPKDSSVKWIINRQCS